MRIFGKRGVKTHITTGTFTCPGCNSTQVYALKQITNFMAIFNVPVIRSEDEKPYIECQNCKSTYIPRVLDYDPVTRDQKFIKLYQEALTRSLALIVLTDESQSSQKKMMMLSMIKKFGNHELQMHDLELILKREVGSEDTAFEKLRKLKPQLNRNGRNLLLKCTLSVAMIDGNLTDFELVIITKLAEILGVSSQGLIGILHEIEARNAA